MKPAIKIKGICKDFRIRHEDEKTLFSTFRSVIIGTNGYEIIPALKDISFDVKKGEILGVIGSNGAGKTTLLQIIAGIITPSKGRVKNIGEITHLLGLGSDINPELTGKDNVFLSGALMGLSKREIRKNYLKVVEFSELKNFIDVKTKAYSSGMKMRLAFSIAMMQEPEILLVDEVFAVGDLSFQKKCFRTFEELKNKGVTIIFVSQGINTLNSVCDRVLWIDSGMVKMLGEPKKVLNAYAGASSDLYASIVDSVKQFEDSFNKLLRSSMSTADQFVRESVMREISSFVYQNLLSAKQKVAQQIIDYLNNIELEINFKRELFSFLQKKLLTTSSEIAFNEFGRSDMFTLIRKTILHFDNDSTSVVRSNLISINKVSFLKGSVPGTKFRIGDLFRVKIDYSTTKRLYNPVFGIAFYNESGVLISGPNTKFDGFRIKSINGKGSVYFTIKSLPFRPGKYLVSVACHPYDTFEPYIAHEKKYSFEVISSKKGFGVVTLDSEWRV